MDISEINNTIEELENGETTFSNCEKLSSLYIVREHLSGDAVVNEYSDILPSYNDYCKYKRLYQLGEVTSRCVEIAMQKVCQEISEFITTLYISIDTSEERKIISDMLQSVMERESL